MYSDQILGYPDVSACYERSVRSKNKHRRCGFSLFFDAFLVHTSFFCSIRILPMLIIGKIILLEQMESRIFIQLLNTLNIAWEILV